MKKCYLLFIMALISLSHTFGQCSPSFTYQTDSTRTVFFTNLTPQNIAFSYQWNFGDGSAIDHNYNTSHYYANNGVYIVTLSVDSGGNPCGLYTDTVYVNYCSASFTSQVNSNFVLFNNTSTASSNTLYTWNFGDGNNSIKKNPSHSYQFAGQYAVSLSLFDSLSGCYSYTFDSVYVSAPQCRAAFNYTTNGDTLFIHNLAANYQTISYDFGDNSFSSQENPVHIYSQTGTFTVCQTVYDSLTNCSDTFCDSLYIFIPPVCEAGFSHTSNKDTLFIQNQASNYHLISYDFGDSTFSNLENPTHIYSKSGSYKVCQTIIDTLYNCSDTHCDSIDIYIPPACRAGFNYVINEDSLSIQNSASNYQVLNYDFGDGNSSSTENPVHIYAQSGSYKVCQTVQDTVNNCIDIFCDSVSIVIPPACKAGFSYQQVGDTVLFLNTAQNEDSLIYFFGDGDSSTTENPSHVYANSGIYIVEQKVFNHRNCIAIYRDTLQLTISTSCVAQYQLALDTNLPSTLFLINTSSSWTTHQYFWDFGDGHSSTQKNPTHHYAENKTYPICLTVSDSTWNCYSSYCDTVGLDSNGSILKSKGFTLQVVDFSAIGIEENSNPLKELTFYPNPAKGSVSVKWPPNVEKMDYLLYNMQGQLVQRGILSKSDRPTMDISKLEIGIYIIQLEADKHQLIRKIVKH